MRGLPIITNRGSRFRQGFRSLGALNWSLKTMFKHPLLVRRDQERGFGSAALITIGNYMITFTGGQLDEERVCARSMRGHACMRHLPFVNPWRSEECAHLPTRRSMLRQPRS